MAVRNVVQPSLTAYLPDPAIASRRALNDAPGGAYSFLAQGNKGIEIIKNK